MAKSTRGRRRYNHTDADIDRFGFRWGQLDVLRIGGFVQHKELSVLTDSHDLSVAVSPEGRSIRVWLDGEPLVKATPLNEEIARLREELQEAKKARHEDQRDPQPSSH